MTGWCGLVREWDSTCLIKNPEFTGILICLLNLPIYVHYTREKTVSCILVPVERDFLFMTLTRRSLCINIVLITVRWFPTIFIQFFPGRMRASWWVRRLVSPSIPLKNILFVTGHGNKDWWVSILMQVLPQPATKVRLFSVVMTVLSNFRQIYRYRNRIIHVCYCAILWSLIILFIRVITVLHWRRILMKLTGWN